MQGVQAQTMETIMHAGRRSDAMDCQLPQKKEDPDTRRKDQAGSSDCRQWKQMLRHCRWMDFNHKAAEFRDGKESYHKTQITKTKDVKYKDQKSTQEA